LKVKNTINEKDPTRAAQIERALLEALDRVQTAWLNQDPSQSANKSALLHSSKYISDFILFHPIIISFNFSDSTLTKPPLHRRLSTQGIFLLNLETKLIIYFL